MAGGAVIAAAGIGAAAFDGAASAAVQPGAGGAASGSRAVAKAQDACYQLSTENVEGPYYIDAENVRADVREDRQGIVLTLRLTVIDSVTCEPVPDAAVDIWHCDAVGVYSGFESGGGGPGGGAALKGTPTTNTRFLRGTQPTDDEGKVEFTTVFPGWYVGRAVHIHVKVHVDGAWTDGGYEGGHVCHTGQFFFDETAVIASASVSPYSTNTTRRTTLDQDGLYDGSGVTGGLLALTYTQGHIEDGVVGTITMGVDPDATHDGTGGP